MKNYKVEKDFIIDDYRCIILGLALGHRCGYVGLPKDHKCNGLDYHDVDIDVHGGLTYASNSNTYPIEDDRYWLGFDCAHYMDGKDFDLIKELNDEETVGWYNEMAIKFPDCEFEREIRTIEYVEQELISMIEQLKVI